MILRFEFEKIDCERSISSLMRSAVNQGPEAVVLSDELEPLLRRLVDDGSLVDLNQPIIDQIGEIFRSKMKVEIGSIDNFSLPCAALGDM